MGMELLGKNPEGPSAAINDCKMVKKRMKRWAQSGLRSSVGCICLRLKWDLLQADLSTGAPWSLGEGGGQWSVQENVAETGTDCCELNFNSRQEIFFF